MRTLTADCASVSLCGTDKENEDCAMIYQGGISCFVLADGLGGHGNGALASSVAAKAACDTARALQELNPETAARCFTAAQYAVTEMQKARGLDCRTTMTLLLTCGRTAIYGHIGDSRVYHIRKNRVLARTLDHSVPQLLLRMGTITEAELAHHPDRNQIVRAVGGDDDSLQFELSSAIRLRGSDSFLLCSDGFWEWIENEDIAAALSAGDSARDALDRMVRLVEERSQPPRDDCSAILVRFQ